MRFDQHDREARLDEDEEILELVHGEAGAKDCPEACKDLARIEPATAGGRVNSSA
jgi:hypothetical protein